MSDETLQARATWSHVLTRWPLGQRRVREEFHVTPIFKEKLQMFRVETKLPHGSAYCVGNASVRRRSRPAARTPDMFKFKITSVREGHDCVIELGVHDVTPGIFTRKIGLHRDN